MKKYRLTIILLVLIILIGCSIANNPTSKVEDLLGKYQRLEKDITIDYQDLSIDNNISKKYTDEYEKIIKNQYQNLSYEIKEEIIDGDNATVTTSIEVIDYKDILNKYSKNEYTTEKYHELIIKDLKDAKNKVTYTIDFTLTKDNKDNWHIDNLTNEIKEKMLGIN